MEVVDFVVGKTFSEIKKILESSPYKISIKEDENYYKLNYNQIESDFSENIVEECRGIIFRKSDNKPVCVPFTKFYNFGETRASKIDWASAKVLEKLDGSIISLWYDNYKWHVSTNGTIDSSTAQLQVSIVDSETRYRIDNYYDLFRLAFLKMKIDYQEFKLNLNKDYTYIFELVSCYNRIVVPYKDTKLYHIGSRNNYTLMEEDLDIGIEKPKKYNIHTLEDCLRVAEDLPFSEEGYVVVDAQWNRVKIKSPAYVAAHHLKNNGVITYSRVLDMIKAGGDDDFISIYPEYREVFKTVKDKLISFIDDCLEILRDFHKVKFETRKEFATWATSKKFPSLLFLLLDEKIGRTSDDVGNYILSIESDKLLKMIGVKE